MQENIKLPNKYNGYTIRDVNLLNVPYFIFMQFSLIFGETT